MARKLSKPLLPEPDIFAHELSKKLCAKIHAAIEENSGAIGFDQYMDLALYEPNLGYYTAGLEKFGEQGDFVTAPEISSLFARCLAVQCAEILAQMHTDACICELGAGSGSMAVDLLQELLHKDSLPKIYYIIEPCAELRQRQQQKIGQKIPTLKQRIVWLQSIPKQQFEGIIVANEVVDAMPVKRIIIDSVMAEYSVTSNTGTSNKKTGAAPFKWQQKDASPKLQTTVQAMLDTLDQPLPKPYIADINFYIQPWLHTLNDMLHKGVILISDYGYARKDFFHPQRGLGSLICHYRHQVHDDPFLYPGLQDITASVDFTTIAETATSMGMQVTGFTTQAHFLIACGLEQFMLEQQQKSTAERLQMVHQANRLTMPGEMGEKFKLIALSKAIDIPLQSFSFFDHRMRL